MTPPRALPLYRFLCDYQHEKSRKGVGFTWGPLNDEFTFLPRVRYRNVIFSFAKWKIAYAEIEKLYSITDPDELLKAVAEWKKDLRLPDSICLADADHKLPIVLTNVDSIRMLLDTVKRRFSFTLEEYPFDPKTAIARNVEGSFSTEAILTFHKNKI